MNLQNITEEFNGISTICIVEDRKEKEHLLEVDEKADVQDQDYLKVYNDIIAHIKEKSSKKEDFYNNFSWV